MFHPDGPTLAELLHQALVDTTEGYDLIAPKFDYTPFRTPDALLEQFFERVAQHGEVERELDVCCGTGAATAHLRRLCTQEVVGVDLSQGMLDQARARLEAQQDATTPFDFGQRNALEMTFERPFDLAVCFGAFGHILPEDQDRFIRRIYDALAPGGRFVFITRHDPSPLERTFWVYRGFNAAMRVRNALIKPPFIMYYLIFTLPRALEVLTRQGFQVQVEAGLSDLRQVLLHRPVRVAAVGQVAHAPVGLVDLKVHRDLSRSDGVGYGGVSQPADSRKAGKRRN